MNKHGIAAGVITVVAILMTIFVALEENDLVLATGIPVIITGFEFFYLKRSSVIRYKLLHLIALYGSAAWLAFLVFGWIMFAVSGGFDIY